MRSRTTDHPRSRRSFAVVGVLVALAVTFTACQPKPFHYGTSVTEPSVTRPARFLDEIFPVDVTSNVPYATADDLQGNAKNLKLDLYEPRGDTAPARPAVVVAHGGGFYAGSKTGGVEVALAQHFAATGYVVVSIDYRLLAKTNCGQLGGDITPASGCITAASAAISDGTAAVRWLRANASTYRIDQDRIGMIGDSAGAIMAIGAGLLWGATDEWMDNAVAGSPQNPVTQALMFGAPANESNPGFDSRINAWSSISGGFPSQVNALDLPRVIADNWPDAPPAPGIFFHGTADNEVLYSWGETLRDQLIDTKRYVVWEGFDGLGHVSSLWSNVRSTVVDQSTWFFTYMLGLDPTKW